MRGNLPKFEITAPKTLPEALAQVAAGARPFAGGTDLMVVIEAGMLKPAKFVSLWGIAGLNRIEVTDAHVAIGALATYTDILEHPVLAQEFPNLGAASRETGALAIQNRGTIGGNIANASPAADTPPSLLIYNAEIELISSKGTRVVPYAGFHTGYKKTVMNPDEIIHRVLIPRTGFKLSHYYRKVGTRKAQAISKVCFSGCIAKQDEVVSDVRIGLGSVAAMPIRIPRSKPSSRARRLMPPPSWVPSPCSRGRSGPSMTSAPTRVTACRWPRTSSRSSCGHELELDQQA